MLLAGTITLGAETVADFFADMVASAMFALGLVFVAFVYAISGRKT
jgi:hypothetical protein